MSSYFQCLRCGAESEITLLPPTCRYCRSGNGLISPEPRSTPAPSTKPAPSRRSVDHARKVRPKP